MASGTIQSRGTAAMFWVMWFDTASNMSEPVAASAHHSSCRAAPGAGSSRSVPVPATASSVNDATRGPRRRLRLDQPAAAHRTTKSTYPADHPSACVRVSAHGSSRNG